jgi:isoquinoline 1-oxidoreductase
VQERENSLTPRPRNSRDASSPTEPLAQPAEDNGVEYDEPLEPNHFDFGLKRRGFVQLLGAGLLIAASAATALAQRAGRRGGFGGSGARNVAARIHFGKDGSITVLTGKVEAGQGARTELTQAAAEELRVPVDRIQLIMADTSLVPDDGITAGSGSTPRTVPAVRQGAAAARQLLLEFAYKQWNVEPTTCEVREGKAIHIATQRSLSYADLASNEEAAKALDQAIPSDVSVTPVKEWKVLGKAASRAKGLALVTGSHKYPSDINRPGMLYGKILRPPSYAARLVSVELGPAKAMKDVVAVQDDQFVAVAAPSTFEAARALAAVAETAKWEQPPHPSSATLYDYLKEHAQGGVPANPFADELAAAKQKLRQEYHAAYVQHAPLEPRAAIAEWTDGKLTVWAGTQNPFGHRSELARAFHMAAEDIQVIVPDFGAAFGGKHTGEAAVEAARLAKAAGKPISLLWTREEEFTWAYFRPAAVIQAEAGLDERGTITSWHFLNINSGPSAVETPYRIEKHKSKFISSTPPLRHGSYRALAATANNFARECFMDELATAAKADPLDFRLSHLDRPENERLRAVLEAAAKRFQWKSRIAKKKPNTGLGLACGTEKGSYVAACVEIEVDRAQKEINVRHVCEVFECGAIMNPDNLLNQVQGAILMGLGPALREEMQFENGKMLTASFRKCKVPRFDDVPELDVQLLNRPDLASAGAGETPIIAIAPAIANAVFHATGTRVRSMPIRLT